MSATEIVHRLTATATDAGPPGKDNAYGYGRLNIVKALTADVPPLTDAPTSATPGTAATSTVKPSTVAHASNRQPIAAVLAVAFVVGAILLVGLMVLIIVLLRRRRRRPQW